MTTETATKIEAPKLHTKQTKITTGGNRAYRRKMASIDRKRPYAKIVDRVEKHSDITKEQRAQKIKNNIEKIQKKKAIRLEKNPVKKEKLTKKSAKKVAANAKRLEQKRARNTKFKAKQLKNK